MSTARSFYPRVESYWVIPGRFRAGEYPGSKNETEARQKLRWLVQQDINVFVDLTEEGEAGLLPYSHILSEESEITTGAVEHKRLPMRDLTTPTQDYMQHLLDTLDLALSLGRKIYLHCYGGKGRTGTAVGCFLVRHGLDGQEALDQIQLMRVGISSHVEQSPETEGQKRMVLQWKQGQ